MNARVGPVQAVLLLVVAAGGWIGPPTRAAEPLGIFTDTADIGTPSTIGAGSARFDAGTSVYTISGGGENMWAAADHFRYVWKKVSGDITLEATIDFAGSAPAAGTPNPHRKACLVLRQTLDSDSVYADAASHGEGLTSLQWRDTKGGATHEVQSNVVGPKRLRIEKRGSYVSMSIAGPGEELRAAGGAARVELTGDFYIGLGVSAHDTGRIETAAFSNVAVGVPAPMPGTGRPLLVNTLETISVQSERSAGRLCRRRRPAVSRRPTGSPTPPTPCSSTTEARCTRSRPNLPATAPNPGRLSVPEPVKLGILTRINNDHGITLDGKTWAISDQSQTVGDATAVAGLHRPCRRRRRPAAHRTGAVVFSRLVAGRQARWPTAPSATGTSTSTPSRARAAPRRGSPPRRARTMALNTHPTGRTSTSTPSGPARCRFGG